MKRATQEQMEAFGRMQNDADVALFVGWIRESLDEADVANRTLASPFFERSQGSAQTLAELLNTLDTAKRNRGGPG